MPDVELPAIIQQWSVNVQLDDVCLLCAISMDVLTVQNGIDFVNFVNDCDAITPIRQLSRLNDPYVPHFMFRLFDNSTIVVLFSVLSLHFLDVVGSSLEVVDKTFVLRIFNSSFNVKCQWNVVEHVGCP